jgi:hypothetical protein
MGHGLSGKAIGSAINRNDSLISQVRRGVKPGANLEPALRQLLAEVEARSEVGAGLDTAELRAAVAEPSRRMSKRGTVAKVRQRVMVRGRGDSWATGDAGRQAARNGARLLGHDVRLMADPEGPGHERAYVTVAFTRDVSVEGTGSKKSHHHHRQNEIEIGYGGNGVPMEDLISAMDTQGNLSEGVASILMERGMISGVATPAEAAARMIHLQVRTV